MSKIDGDDFAFPQTETAKGNPIGCEHAGSGGLTVREYFTAKAMQAIVAATFVTPPGTVGPWETLGISYAEFVADQAVKMADFAIGKLGESK